MKKKFVWDRVLTFPSPLVAHSSYIYTGHDNIVIFLSLAIAFQSTSIYNIIHIAVGITV